VHQSFDAILQEAPTPFADRVFVDSSSAATTLLCVPSVQRRIIRYHSDIERAMRRRRTCRTKYSRSSAAKTRGSVGRPPEFAMLPSKSEGAAYNETYFSSK